MCEVTKIVGLLFSTIFLCSSIHAADKIRIGNPLDAGLVTLPLAQKRGFLKEQGIEAEIIRMAGPVAAIVLPMRRSIILPALPLPCAPLYADRRSHSYMLSPCCPFILARPEIKSIKELRGQTIGFTGEQRGPDIAARKMLEHFGLDPNRDVKFIRAGTTEGRLAAITQGLIAATAVPVP